jgi:CSLREA domain-containing protein
MNSITPAKANRIRYGFVLLPLVCLLCFSAHAQIVVNSTRDKPSAYPLSPGVCSADVFHRSECTLRAAIQLANYNPDVTTITCNIPTTDPGYNAQTHS